MTKIVRALVVTLGLTGVMNIAAPPANASQREHIFVPAIYGSAAHVTRLAEKGNMNAQAQLAWMYATGRGVPQDFYKAAKWYYAAAMQGHGRAQFELGLLYNKGQGVPCDYMLSYMWLNLSASQATGDDRDFKVRMRDAIASKLTVAQLTRAQEMALAWYKTR
jgi:uncharacterized protein